MKSDANQYENFKCLENEILDLKRRVRALEHFVNINQKLRLGLRRATVVPRRKVKKPKQSEEIDGKELRIRITPLQLLQDGSYNVEGKLNTGIRLKNSKFNFGYFGSCQLLTLRKQENILCVMFVS